MNPKTAVELGERRVLDALEAENGSVVQPRTDEERIDAILARFGDAHDRRQRETRLPAWRRIAAIAERVCL